MSDVCIGVHVHAEPNRLLATLESIRRNTRIAVDLLLLPDAPNTAVISTLGSVRNVRQLGTENPLGVAACFNRLVTASDADVMLLLESGCIVAPGWLEYLLAALNADATHGLAGPSTNRSWNEQGRFLRAGGSWAEIDRTAKAALEQFGATWQTLEPLYSLADFCYAVRREVVDAIGAANEGYGLGPCWEMDYNIRAARAGFKGVWARGAYVWRAPPTTRRRNQETRHFSASKRLYQDRFCGRRLRGEGGPFRRHCRGDACQNFAPPSLIQRHQPMPETSVAAPLAISNTPALDSVQGPPSHPEMPLVSCIMPTGNRADYVLQSIRYLQRQDCASWELIIVDDGQDSLADHLPEDKRLRYRRVQRGLSIGAKRNLACSLARGEFIAQWDDDDWYGPGRLRAQLGPLLADDADITGLNDTIFFELDRWRFWRCTDKLYKRLFVENVHGGTLVYRRRIWQKHGRYPDRSLAEDAIFLRQALRGGARLQRISGDGMYLYLRHGSNSWAFQCGQYLDRGGWIEIEEPELPVGDRQFFIARRGGAPLSGSTNVRGLSVQPTLANSETLPLSSQDPAVAAAESVARTGQALSPAIAGEQLPLVSCIMPTADRRRFVGQAIRYFLRQDYPARELIILDDGQDAVADLVPADDRIQYRRLSHRLSVGAKRNRACELARGEIIVHCDDDDWMAPWRLRYQIESLLQEGADINGLDRVLYLDPLGGQGWRYVYPASARSWVAGNTLCYRRVFWQRNPFPEIDVGEDTRFVWSDQRRHLVALEDPTFFVGVIHPHNVSPKSRAGRRWQSYSLEGIRKLMGEDWIFYQQPRNAPNHT